MPLEGERKREYQREWLANRRANFFADKACVRCGSAEQLELDHIDPEQKVSHRIWSWSQERRDAEIAKCQVLCAECHKAKSAAYVNSILGYAGKDECERGHPLALVGMYDKLKNGGGNCKYCHHLKDAARRGHRVKPLIEFIEYQERKRIK